jgi:hypothetical protein
MTDRFGERRVYVARCLCAVLLAATLVVPGLAAMPDLPPLAEHPTGEHHVGKLIWAELVTPDMESAQRFYAGLFGWTFQDVAIPSPATDNGKVTRYALALLDGQPVGGILLHPLPTAAARAQPAWLTFLAVGDVDAAGRIALAHGAKMLSEPKSYGRRGRQAILADPQGAVFAIMASSSGDSPDFLAQPGQWMWSSLLAPDADKEAAFYQELFAYEVYELPSSDGREHVILSSDDYARASINSMPDDAARRHPHWLNFVRVLHVPDASAKAVSLGGRVLVAPHIDRHGEQVAIVADPQGAPLGLMEWSETVEPGSAK